MENGKYYQEIQNFSNACTMFCESKYILSDPRLSEILKSIAASGVLVKIMEELTCDYDFEKEYISAKLPLSTGSVRLEYPEEKNEFIAFVFYLLFYIDQGRIEFSDFLFEYYARESINQSFNAFCEVVDKFRRSLLSLFDADEPEEPKAVETKIEIDINIINELELLIAELVTLVSGENEKLTLSQKDETLVACDSLIKALYTGENKIVFAVFIAIKYSVTKFFDNCEVTLESLYNILAKNNLI